jgi:hypothetical protein
LLRKLLSSNPTTFHSVNLVEAAAIQFTRRRLHPAFFDGVLRTYGLFAIRRFCFGVLPQFIETFDGGGRIYIASLVPYLAYFPADLQIKLHSFLVSRCECRRFDSKLFELTATAILASAPTVSPLCGRFLNAAAKSVCNGYVYAALRALLEPMGPPPQQSLSGMIVLPEDSKQTAETQVVPEHHCADMQTGSS